MLDATTRMMGCVAGRCLERGLRMTARQSSIIRFLDRLQGHASKLHHVKLAFVVTAALPRSAIYEFVPYKYGPYSFTLHYDLAQMARDGWIETTGTEVRLLGFRNEAPRELTFGFAAEVDRILDKYVAVPVASLVADVYRRYPWYTANSNDPSRRAVKLPKARIAV